jgi:hypothetical protein
MAIRILYLQGSDAKMRMMMTEGTNNMGRDTNSMGRKREEDDV